MENTSYQIITKPRHLRYMFFIDGTFTGSKLLDLINKNQQLWGGRQNPIIPVGAEGLTPEWQALAKNYDPDYVGYTNGFTEALAIKFCQQLGLNPLKVLNIEDNVFRMEGIPSQFLLSTFDNPFAMSNYIAQSSGLWQSKSPLKEYYKLNYLFDDHHQFVRRIIGSHHIIHFNGYEIEKFNQQLVEYSPLNSIALAAFNPDTTQMRTVAGTHYRHFELILTKNYDSQKDLLYHWNRALYSPSNYPISSFLITEEQLDLLLRDPYFEGILGKLPTNDATINVVSFSLSEKELLETVQKLQGFATHVRFLVAPSPIFPYEKSDNKGHAVNKEQSLAHIVYGETHLVEIPNLSFAVSLQQADQSWCAEISITEVSKNNSIFFPMNTRGFELVRSLARINKNRRLVAILNSRNNRHIRLRTPSFFSIIHQVIVSPSAINEPPYKRPPTKYLQCKFNDGSNRLKEFINLFDGNFTYIEDYLFDKFWADIFYDLTDNTKSEGDTITFDQIIQRYYHIITEAGINDIGPKSETHYNDENLRYGVQDTLQPLINRRIFLPGYNIKCKSCSSIIWYSLKETDFQITCKGCGTMNFFAANSPISYKLNHLVKNNIGMRNGDGKFAPDGNYTAIKTLIHLRNKAPLSFQYVPQIDIFDSYHRSKPVMDLDIICIVNGLFYIGECKHNSNLFFADKNKCLDNLIEIAQIVNPDFIILSCTVDEYDRLQRAQQYLEHYIKRLGLRSQVYSYQTRVPEYDLKSYRFFRY
ncbi:hypothetical protein HB364_14010 [Pseudoflavitalea sp. X16]|uniref:hypothetical protein n=1 Tax=Paraflavitalea devenefica TaxID=2716334 RepID=UPI001421147C|nr:hypothetical protein [Paraflavitalea devenefica]NII26204.1 hypothetical protein [Paraflavitalea devenefica]